MLKIEIKTGGAAYRDDDVLTIEGRYELQRNLMDISRKLTKQTFPFIRMTENIEVTYTRTEKLLVIILVMILQNWKTLFHN